MYAKYSLNHQKLKYDGLSKYLLLLTRQLYKLFSIRIQLVYIITFIPIYLLYTSIHNNFTTDTASQWRYKYLPIDDHRIIPSRSSTHLYAFDRIYVNTWRPSRWNTFMAQVDPDILPLTESQQQFRKYIQKVQAVDGNQLNRTEWVNNGLLEHTHPVDRNRTLTRGELASTHTHYNIWGRLLHYNLSSALILEDDARIDLSEQHDMWLNLQSHIESAGLEYMYDVIYLGYNWRPAHAPINDGLFSFVQFQSPPQAKYKYSFHVVHAYLLTTRGAAILRANILPYRQPVDVYVGEMCGKRRINCLQINPSFISTLPSSSDTQLVE